MKNRKFFAVILAVALLLTFAVIFSACGEKKDEKPVETNGQNNETTVIPNDSTEPAETDINTDPADPAEGTDPAETDINTDPADPAEGTDPSETANNDDPEDPSEPELAIREELKPLFEALTKEGDKFFKIKTSAVLSDAAGAETACSIIIAGKNKADGLELAIVDENEKTILLCKDGVVNVYGYTWNLMPEILTYGEETEGVVFDVSGSLDTDALVYQIFSYMSLTLDKCDEFFESSFLNINASKEDGVYSIDTDSRILILIAQLLAGDDEKVANITSDAINFVDELLGGALKAGDFKVALSFSVKDESLAIDLNMQDIKTAQTFALTASFEVFDEEFEIAEPEQATSSDADETAIKDIEITVPLYFPAKDKGVTLNAVLHLAEIIKASDGDYINASVVFDENNEIATIILNRKFIYANMSHVKFYQAFEIDGQPVSIFEYIKSIIFSQNDNDEYISEDIDVSEGNGDETEIYYGYSVSDIDNLGKVILPIGATESDLRSKLCFVVFDENDESIEVTDYQIIGFDSSASFSDYIDISFQNIETSYEVVIRNAENEECIGFDFEPVRLALGSDVATAEQDSLYADIIMTDGQVQWTIYKNGFTVDKVNGETVDSGYVFNAKGNITLSLTHKNGETTEVSAYVYDPENLEIIDVDIYPDNMYLYEYLTEEELRDRIYVSVLYDDGSWKDIETFEIIGYEPRAAEFEVKFGEYVKQITVEYDDYIGEDQPTEEPGGFNILDLLKYLRVTDILESDDPVSAVVELLEQNKELLGSVFTVDKETQTLRIVINSSDGGDLIQLINVFFGIPGEDGFTDIDETYLLSSDDDIVDFFELVTGVKLADALTDLCVDVKVSFGNGFAVSIELGNGAEVKYLTTGIGLNLVDATSPNTELTAEDVAGAHDFNYFFVVLLAAILQELVP